LAYAVVGALAVLALVCIAGGTSWAARKAHAPEQPVETRVRPSVRV
jgi:hypothetical protein